VMDANNYYPQRDGHIPELDENKVGTGDLLAQHLPKSKIVKVFNAIMAGDIVADAKPKGAPDRRAHPIAGDDAEAKNVVANFLDQIGFDPVDVGNLVESRRFAPDTPAYCVPFQVKGLKEALAMVG
jgi:8-hydroxy-5-deazaflavin:NADPH oxidoreductase